MAISLPEQIKQIAVNLTPSNQSGVLYKPRTISVLNSPIPLQGYTAVIRCCAFINSIPETWQPVPDPTDTTARKMQKWQAFRASARKGLLISLRKGSQKTRIGIIDLYNVQPCFLTGANEYFSALEIYGIEPGWEIFAEIIDRGFGFLENKDGKNDEIDVSGYTIERGAFLQDHNLNIIPCVPA